MRIAWKCLLVFTILFSLSCNKAKTPTPAAPIIPGAPTIAITETPLASCINPTDKPGVLQSDPTVTNSQTFNVSCTQNNCGRIYNSCVDKTNSICDLGQCKTCATNTTRCPITGYPSNVHSQFFDQYQAGKQNSEYLPWSCSNLTTDINNCGQCGVKCTGTEKCVDGKCSCATGNTICDETCVDLLVDNNNCGNCGTKCSSTQVCAERKCVANTAVKGNMCDPFGWTCGAGSDCLPSESSTCGVGTHEFYSCDVCKTGYWYNTVSTSTSVCGHPYCTDENKSNPLVVESNSSRGTWPVDSAPPVAESCVSANAGAAGSCHNCSSIQTLCGSTCVNTHIDMANCGGCGNTCTSTPPSALKVCAEGKCVVNTATKGTACDPFGWAKCLSSGDANCIPSDSSDTCQIGVHEFYSCDVCETGYWNSGTSITSTNACGHPYCSDENKSNPLVLDSNISRGTWTVEGWSEALGLPASASLKCISNSQISAGSCKQ